MFQLFQRPTCPLLRDSSDNTYPYYFFAFPPIFTCTFFVSALVTGQTTTTIQLTVLREMHDALAIDFSGFLKAFEIVFFRAVSSAFRKFGYIYR